MCGFGFRFRTSSTAEAPRRHVGHVGESNRTMQTSGEAALNDDRSCSKFPCVSATSAGCPAGTVPARYKYQPRASKPTTLTTAKIPRTFFIGYHPQYLQAHSLSGPGYCCFQTDRCSAGLGRRSEPPIQKLSPPFGLQLRTLQQQNLALTERRRSAQYQYLQTDWLEPLRVVFLLNYTVIVN